MRHSIRIWALRGLFAFWLGYRVIVPRLFLEHESLDRAAASFIAIAALGITLSFAIPRVRRPLTAGRRQMSFFALSVMLLVFSSAMIVVSTVAAVGWWRFPAYLQGLPSYQKFVRTPALTEPYPPFDETTLVDLGWAQESAHHPRTSYLEFPAVKPKGTIRIGVFGDSFTEGEEAAVEHDYASFLQRDFRERQRDDTQVINFGVHAYGFHQMIRMWEALGQRYDLDYTIMMPFAFHRSRDNSFISNASDFSPLHARYAIDGDGVRLVRPVGASRRTAAEGYFRPLPPWRYWRYDHAAPPLLQAFLSGAGTFPFNPFYYRRDEAAEMYAIDTRLLRDWAARAAHPIVIADDDEILSWRRDCGDGIVFLESSLPLESRAFAYRAPFGHLSALGNELRARELSQFLSGDNHASYRLLRFVADDGMPAMGAGEGPLDQYDSVTVGIAGRPLAGFVKAPGGPTAWRSDGPVDFRGGKVASLLLLPGSEPEFAPLPFPLREGATVTLRFRAADREIEIPLGTVEVSAGVVGRLRLSAGAASGAGWRLDAAASDFTRFVSLPASVAVSNLALAIDGRVALTGARLPRIGWRSHLRDLLVGRRLTPFALTPVSGVRAVLRGEAGQYVDPRRLAKAEGNLDLLLAKEGRLVRTVSLPIRYRVATVDGPSFSAGRGLSSIAPRQ